MEQNSGLTPGLIIQYSIVGVILLVACIWIVWKSVRKKRKSSSSCCGCSLSDSCNKKQR